MIYSQIIKKNRVFSSDCKTKSCSLQQTVIATIVRKYKKKIYKFKINILFRKQSRNIGKLDPHDICIKSRYYTPQLGLKLNCFALYLQKFISDQKVYPIFEVPMVEMFNSITFLCVMLYACLSESTKVCNHIGSIVYIQWLQ